MASASVMNLPCFVLPYQRSPSRWKTFVSVLTQTIPLTGGCWGVPAAGSAAGFPEAGWEAILLEPAEREVSVVGAAGFGGGAVSAAALLAETVTIEPILSIVDALTPARDKSATEE